MMYNKIRLIETHKFDFISGYEFATITYKDGKRNVVIENGTRVLYKSDNNLTQYSLFVELSNVLNLDWFNNLVDTLENEYYLSQSGNKFISIYLQRLMKQYETSIKFYQNYYFLPQIIYKHIANVLSMKYKTKWDKLYNIMISEYNPLNNIKNNESRSISKKETKTYNLSNTKTGKDIDTYTGTNNIYGFDSINPVPNNDGSSSNTTTYDNNLSRTGTEIREYLPNDNIENIERSGNNGKITFQELINQEIETRKYNIINTIYNDIDNLLTSQIYE